jgi:cell wall-associated NlpC family hydrolase
MMSANEYLTVVGTVEGLNLRTMPNAGAQIIKCIPNGNRLDIVELGRDWHYVTYNGASGYVSARFTAFSDELNARGAATAFAASDLASQIIANAKQYLGARYTWGGTSVNTGFDCSGFVYTVYKSVGITLNRSSRDQIRNGTIVSRNSLQPGDLVFFATSGGSRISHVGIYIGGGDFIHSSSSGRRGVVISSLNETYYNRTYVNACRVIN